MRGSNVDRMTTDYLRQLHVALSEVPRPRRRQLVAEIAEHLAEARAQLVEPSAEEVAKLLDRIGRPADIAEAAIEAGAGAGSGSDTRRENWAVALLLVGSVVLPVVGWIAGVRLLWASKAWNLRDKLIGTFLLPGGLLPAVLYVLLPGFAGTATRPCPPHASVTSPSGLGGTLQQTQCQYGSHTLLPVAGAGGGALVAALFLVPVLTAIYLNHRKHTKSSVNRAASCRDEGIEMRASR